MLATSWKATGLVRAAWRRLDVQAGHREELAALTGIRPNDLSRMNTGKRAMTLETAQRIADAVPGLTVYDLGAPAEAEDAADSPPSVPDRLAALEEREAQRDREQRDFAERVFARLGALEAAAGIQAPQSAPRSTGAEDGP